MSDNEAENVPLLSGKLLALCDYMHIRALFSDKAQLEIDTVLVNICPSLFMFLKRLFLQVLPAHELESLLQRRKEWHDANISKFVEAWKDYVDPAGVEAAKPLGACGLDNVLPE